LWSIIGKNNRGRYRILWRGGVRSVKYNGETGGVYCFCLKWTSSSRSLCLMAVGIHHHFRNENAITIAVCKATSPVVVVPVVRLALEDGDRDTPPLTPFPYLSQMFCKWYDAYYIDNQNQRHALPLTVSQTHSQTCYNY